MMIGRRNDWVKNGVFSPSGTACRSFFNERAQGWDDFVHHDISIIAEIMTFARLRAGESVLDIGTGTGIMIPILRNAIGPGGRLVALDVAERMLAKAEEKHGVLADEYWAVDFLALDDRRSFDALIAYSCFPHFTDRQGFFTASHRLLKEGGRLIIAHSESRESINALHSGGSVERVSLPLPSVIEVAALAEEWGFTVGEMRDDERFYLLVAYRNEV